MVAASSRSVHELPKLVKDANTPASFVDYPTEISALSFVHGLLRDGAVSDVDDMTVVNLNSDALAALFGDENSETP